MFSCRNLLRSVLHVGVLLAQKLTVRAGQRQMVAHGGRCGGFVAVFQGLADGLVSGARALTSSAGPGFSLNQEGISYLVAADLPAVIIDVMRIGTGLGDIAQGQGDYWQMTRGGGHGDYRTIVLAPASVQENCDMMATAFDLAEKYRHPVLVASDAAIGQMVDDVKLAVENKYPVGFYGTFFGLPEPEEIVAQAKAMLEKERK